MSMNLRMSLNIKMSLGIIKKTSILHHMSNLIFMNIFVAQILIVCFYSKCLLYYSLQARNQNFFRAGEVSWDEGTFINILLKTPEKKAPQGQIWEFFLLDTLQTTLENVTQKWTQPGHFLQNQGTFFSIFEIGQGRPPRPSCAPAICYIYVCYFMLFIRVLVLLYAQCFFP